MEEDIDATGDCSSSVTSLQKDSMRLVGGLGEEQRQAVPVDLFQDA